MSARDIATIAPAADIILSESVLEHVDELETTYEAFGRWLAPDGVMVHLIDYTSHNLSEKWNGHWGCSGAMWSMARGKRHYFINRVPHHGHLDLLEKNGMKVVHSELLRRTDGLLADQLATEFQCMHPVDLTTALAQVVCTRR